jgi:hypothetical protein
MPIDPSIPLQAQGPNLSTLGSFLQLGQQKLALDKGRATYDADVAANAANSRSAVARATVDTANVQPLIQQQQAAADITKSQLSQTELETMRKHLANSAQQLQTLITDPNINVGKVQDTLYQTLKNSGAPASAYAQAFQNLPPKNASPDDLKKYLAQSLAKAQDATAQLNSLYPAPAVLNSGQEAIPVAVGNEALTGVKPGTQVGQPTQMQVPPTATTMGPGGQPTYVGAQPQPRAPIPAGPAIGQVEGTLGPIKTATDHYQNVVAEAQPAQTRISALQTIRQEAPGAVTGGGDWKRKILTQLSGALGIAYDEQTANDVMAKNLSVLAQNAGNTDAARTLGEMGNPNVKMTKEAIEQTANQLIGIEKKKIAAQQAFSGIPTNSPEYTKRMAQWSRVADPRLFEYAGLDDAGKKHFLSKLSASQRADLAMKAKGLHDMGVEP